MNVFTYCNVIDSHSSAFALDERLQKVILMTLTEDLVDWEIERAPVLPFNVASKQQVGSIPNHSSSEIRKRLKNRFNIQPHECEASRGTRWVSKRAEFYFILLSAGPSSNPPVEIW